MHHIDGDGIDRLFYWITFAGMLIASRVFGAVKVAYESIESIEIPVHDIKYLPQAEDLIPALIICACCALVSGIIGKIVGVIWDKMFPKKTIK